MKHARLIEPWGSGAGRRLLLRRRSWNARHQTQTEVARAQFFEAAQGQFHWPRARKIGQT
jgi:hypothetical protein